MKILLTGKPGIGKSTILKEVRSKAHYKFQGIIAQEILDKNHNRIGFEAKTLGHQARTFAHKHSIKSSYQVADFFVDLDVIENFIVPEFKKGIHNSETILLIDEIGRMQSLSKKFMDTLEEIFTGSAHLLGTIVYEPEPWSLPFKNHPNIIIVEVSKKNREKLGEILITICDHLHLYNKLPKNIRDKIFNLTKKYFVSEQYLQLHKLYFNAVKYLSQKKYKQLTETPYKTFQIEGITKNHIVSFNELTQTFTCDCDLFNRRNEYSQSTGECSHIQTIALLLT